MPFQFFTTVIPGLLLIQPEVFADGRGFFMEAYKRSDFAANGIPDLFVQSNHSRSSRGVLRGLHYQLAPKAQGKLVRVLTGKVFDVAVDIRRGSPTYSQWLGMELSDSNRSLIYVPPGFAHGFYVISDIAELEYWTTEEYTASHEAGILWNDPALGITWPAGEPLLSERDRNWPGLGAAENNFSFGDNDQPLPGR